MSGSKLRSKVLPVTLGLLTIASVAAYAQITRAPVTTQPSGEGGLPFGARLTGIEETPSIFTPAKGTFDATLDIAGQQLTYTLSYSGLSAPVTVAHIHFGQTRVAGAIIAFLCGGGGKPDCPQDGQVSGTVTASDIIAVDAQGVPANSFDALVTAITSGAGYANVHTQAHPAGEIRGQLRS